jgi:hypothetical protein
MKLLIERELAGQETAIESGKSEFQIVGIETSCFARGSGTGAGSQSDVPHALDDGANCLLRLFFGFFVGEGEEDIDVGVREEILSAVTTQCQERYIQLRQVTGPAPHFNQDSIDDGGTPPDCCRSIPGAFTGLAHERHLLEILLPKIVDLQNDCTHSVVGVACRSKKELLQA